ncbi:MAG: restriction endonuclease [Candidatus Campbellbacteria bacterium]|nr:restriction endonuclease [Candidatus Campbellbacteria bacterium]
MNKHDKGNIIKVDGSIETFDKKKLQESIIRSGATMDVSNKAVEHIEKYLRGSIRTDEIYRRVFSFLKTHNKKNAMRYSLKRALLHFGPTGFPFERFVAELFNMRGYKTKVGEVISGRCASHEVDVFATSGSEKIAIEVKFHNKQRYKTDMKTALYIKARFDDLLSRTPSSLMMGKITKGLLVTNTHFTSTTIRYAKCVGLEIIGWGYPKRKGNLQNLIEDEKIHPITCLTSLDESDMRQLFAHNLVLCRDVVKEGNHLRHLGIAPSKVAKLVNESIELCS